MTKFEVLDDKWLKITQNEKKACIMKLDDINYLKIKFNSRKYRENNHVITISCPSGEFDLVYESDDNKRCSNDYESIMKILGIPGSF